MNSQDLSLAGKCKGMSKGSSTRSGLLWEVERILDECKEIGNLPQILLMENVPQVIGSKNINDFQNWEQKLQSLGYSNYIEKLNSKEYLIPQNRERCFMISILGDYSYNFPTKKKLGIRLKDVLENNVDESYYLNDKMISCLTNEDTKGFNRAERFIQTLINTNFKGIASTVETRAGTRPTSNFIISKSLKETLSKNDDIQDCDYIDTYNKVVRKDIAGAITTRISASNNTFIAERKEDNMKTKLCNELIASGKVKEFDVIRHSYSSSRMNGEMKDIQQNNISPTLDTRCDCLDIVVKSCLIQPKDRNYNKNGSKREEQLEIRKDEVANCLLTKDIKNIVAIQLIPFGSYYTWKDNKGNINTQCNRASDENGCSLTIPTISGLTKVFEKSNLRIRKLSPLECWRLMGVKEEDYNNVSKNQSNASLYHLAGDSIVTSCLMGIFGELLEIDWKAKVDELVKDIIKKE